jgi:hypothetical protein
VGDEALHRMLRGRLTHLGQPEPGVDTQTSRTVAPG